MIRHLCAKMRILLVLVCCTLFPIWSLAESAVASDFTLRYGDRSMPRIAITIDDCYDRKHILAAIELCEEYGIPVTFFPIGKALKFADSALWQRALDAGCEIGNHSWGHTNLTKLSTREIRFQMLRTQQKLDEMLGYHYPMQVMRPPFGSTNSTVSEAVASVGYLHAVKWDVSQTDATLHVEQFRLSSLETRIDLWLIPQENTEKAACALAEKYGEYTLADEQGEGVQYSEMDYLASATPYVTQIDGQWICRYLSQMPGLLQFPESISFIAGGDELICFDLVIEE